MGGAGASHIRRLLVLVCDKERQEKWDNIQRSKHINYVTACEGCLYLIVQVGIVFSLGVCESTAKLLLTQVLCFKIRLCGANHSCRARLLLRRWPNSHRLVPLEIPLANRKHLRVRG